MSERVTVIATVLNEAEAIEALLQSLERQTRPPDEVIIVDGGSTDGTLEKLEHFARQGRLPLKVLSWPGCNISQGRNLAIRAAQGALIASTDAGVRLEDDWLERLIAPFEGERPPDVVGGFFLADPRSPFELALGAVTLPLPEEIKAERFYPSSRSVAFRREAWQAVGGYPEWLDYCEDLLFDFALRDAGYSFAFAPQALVHFRPRKTLAAFFKQYYRYARGDGKADFWRVRHAIRYATYLIALPLLIALTLGHHPLWVMALVAGFEAMMRTPLRRIGPRLKTLPLRERLIVLGWLPIIRLTGDVAKMVGYPVGVWWRLRYAPKIAWPKRQF
jgi:glycosyltransferase involved in cell wall biosynthesis